MPQSREAKSFFKRPLEKPRSASVTKRKTKNYHKRIQKPFSRPQYFPPAKSFVIKNSSKLEKVMKACFILGFLFLFFYFSLGINQTIQLSYVTPKVSPSLTSKGQEKMYAVPSRIIIPKVGIDLPIEETTITNGVWQISQKGASHLAISARPGQKRAIIMYGHNTNEKFGPIRWLTKGERVDVQTKDGKKHTYIIIRTMKVAPNKMDVFTQEKGENLILYTCDGFADLERFVIIATPLQ